MGFSDVWNRTLVYFGIAEEEEWDDEGYVTEEDAERSYSRENRHNVRRLSARRGRDVDDWTDPEPDAGVTQSLRPPTRLRALTPTKTWSARRTI